MNIMSQTQKTQPDQDAAAQAEFEKLHPEQQEIVRQAMKNHPDVSLAKTLEMLNAFGL
jgi:hypothetical protein